MESCDRFESALHPRLMLHFRLLDNKNSPDIPFMSIKKSYPNHQIDNSDEVKYMTIESNMK